MNRHLATAAIAAALTWLVMTPVFANGDGAMGGGGTPSSSSSMPDSGMPAIDAVKRYQDGVTALQAEKWRDAQRAFRDALSADSRDANTNYMLGMAYAGDGKFKDSRRYFENAVKYSKGDLAEARGWLGRAYLKSGDAKDAKKVDEQKAALDAMKAKCAGTCKDAAAIDEAIKRIDDTRANPSAAVSPALGLPHLDAAIGDAAYLAAAGLINQGRYTEALDSLRAAALVFGPHPDILTYQGFAHRKLGHYQTAIAFYSQALKLQPLHRGANEYLGEYFVEIGDLARARAQLAKLETVICKFGCEEAQELRRWFDGKHS